jgi:hypothetical protein
MNQFFCILLNGTEAVQQRDLEGSGRVVYTVEVYLDVLLKGPEESAKHSARLPQLLSPDSNEKSKKTSR